MNSLEKFFQLHYINRKMDGKYKHNRLSKSIFSLPCYSCHFQSAVRSKQESILPEFMRATMQSAVQTSRSKLCSHFLGQYKTPLQRPLPFRNILQINNHVLLSCFYGAEYTARQQPHLSLCSPDSFQLARRQGSKAKYQFFLPLCAWMSESLYYSKGDTIVE